MSTQIIETYLGMVRKVHDSGVTTEHSFRPALQYLFDQVADHVQVINEPKAVVNVGRPDFVFKRTIGQQQITIGHCEAKDIDKDINPRAMKDFNKGQYQRYIKGLPNLIYTNGLDFRFYVSGDLVREVSIGEILMGVQSKPDGFRLLWAQLEEFTRQKLQTLTSAKRLAELRAGKALMIKEALFQSLKQDPDLNTELAGQYKAFKEQLIHDLTPESFADLYAETVAYGMFAARLNDPTLEDFSRQEALELLPKSNPFLRNLFGYIAGPTLDEKIRRDIDELAEIFLATDVKKLFKNFGNFTQRNDPFIHFYETFLAEYNPKKRKARGVWYTPEPVVNFIVRAVDDVLKSEFGLPDGLADTSKVTVEVDTGQTKTVRGKSKPVIEKREMHRVQILDPATGTGTFLAEVIKQIAPKIKDVAPGKWSRYVEEHLIPRLHGFELLMASYAMCHMKLDMMLKDMDYVPTAKAPRLSVYLTNSLEEGEREVRDLFMAQWLSNEAKAANEIKRDKPIMCIIGNPPYSISSSNNGDWIMNLLSVYKNVEERNLQPLNDDYVKFIRLSEHMIEKNGEGILGFITNHGYFENLTFRAMREKLLATFDKVFILDLHGNSNKQEVGPAGVDQNVFDIQQGVGIVIAIKRKGSSSNNSLSPVYHADLWGKRSEKYKALWKGDIGKKLFKKVKTSTPNYFFSSKDYSNRDIFEKGFSIKNVFIESNTGIKSHRDSFVIDKSLQDLKVRIKKFFNANLSNENIISVCQVKNTKSWNVEDARKDNFYEESKLQNIQYRPFDFQWIYFDKRLIDRHRASTMQHFFNGQNFGLLSPRMTADGFDVLCTSQSVSNKTASRYDQTYCFPLYLYPDEGDLDQTRRVNMDDKIRADIEKAVMGSAYTPRPSSPGPDGPPQDEALSGTQISPHPEAARQRGDSKGEGGAAENRRPNEVDIFDYIYGVLHCPAYRETYAEFLKIDFPRVPYPSSPERFWDIAAKGRALRKLHLMESDAIGDKPYPFMGESEDEQGRDIVVKPAFDMNTDGTGRVHISDSQYFDGVPKLAWEFYIGGYQPAQKWLKDRKGRELSWDDIRHYQSIIKILSETDRIMKTIEMDLDA